MARGGDRLTLLAGLNNAPCIAMAAPEGDIEGEISGLVGRTIDNDGVFEGETNSVGCCGVDGVFGEAKSDLISGCWVGDKTLEIDSGVGGGFGVATNLGSGSVAVLTGDSDRIVDVSEGAVSELSDVKS